MEFVRTEPGDDPIVVEGYFAAPPEKGVRSQDARRGIGSGWEAAFTFMTKVLEETESGLR